MLQHIGSSMDGRIVLYNPGMRVFAANESKTQSTIKKPSTSRTTTTRVGTRPTSSTLGVVRKPRLSADQLVVLVRTAIRHKERGSVPFWQVVKDDFNRITGQQHQSPSRAISTLVKRHKISALTRSTGTKINPDMSAALDDYIKLIESEDGRKKADPAARTCRQLNTRTTALHREKSVHVRGHEGRKRKMPDFDEGSFDDDSFSATEYTMSDADDSEDDVESSMHQIVAVAAMTYNAMVERYLLEEEKRVNKISNELRQLTDEVRRQGDRIERMALNLLRYMNTSNQLPTALLRHASRRDR